MSVDRPPVDRGTLESWAALVAHQLGEGVALVRGASTILRNSQETLGADGRDAVRAMLAGTDRAQRFVDDLLDVVRAADEPVPPRADASLGEALELSVEELDPFLVQSGVAVRSETLPAVSLERFEAERLVLHLVRAAIAAGAKEIRVSASVADDWVTLQVADDGAPPLSGSSPLEPFGTPRGRGPLVGAGVSLVVSRRIAERRGGTLTLDVREDGTTAVVVTLPQGASET